MQINSNPLMLKKSLLTLAAIFCFASLNAQKYIDKAGSVKFFSTAPLEDIEAKSTQVSSVIDASTQDLVALVMMRSFVFPNSLMQEHFNENYIESELYPKATFKGKLTDFDKLAKTPGLLQKVKVSGEMNMHGVTRPFETVAEITWLDDKSFKGHAVFKIKLADYNIEIPTMVFQNIAEIVDVTLDLNFKAQ